MPKSVFVSYVYEDRHWKDKVIEWAGAGRLGWDIVATAETRDVRQDGERAVRAYLSPKLTGAAVVLVLVGQNTHNHAWVEYEVNHALSQRKKVVLVRIPGTTGVPPPPVRFSTETTFDPVAIAAVL